jgi:hypothetical protein
MFVEKNLVNEHVDAITCRDVYLDSVSGLGLELVLGRVGAFFPTFRTPRQNLQPRKLRRTCTS